MALPQCFTATDGTPADDADHNRNIDLPAANIDVLRGKIDVRPADIRISRRTSM
jgi:hypothetical protein